MHDPAIEQWNPDKISQKGLGKCKLFLFIKTLILDCYLANLKLLWPYHLYKYSEDHALAYLVCKGYDVETALTTLVVDIEDLISQLKNHDNRMADFFNKSNSKFSYVPISAR